MSGAIDPVAVVVSAVCLGALITDLLQGKIYNWLTVPAMFLGLGLAFFHAGFAGLSQALLGLLVGWVLYGWVFWLRFMGAGDVKLLMALGALGGVHFVAEVALMGLLLGGLMSIGILLARGRLFKFVKKMYQFVLSVFITQLELQVPKIDRKLTMPFGIAISIAGVWTYFAHPLVKWGLTLWP